MTIQEQLGHDLGRGCVLLDALRRLLSGERRESDQLHAVANGGNNSRVLDPWETGTLQVTLRNFGREAGIGITATLSCSTPSITIVDGTASFANISPRARSGSFGFGWAWTAGKWRAGS